MLAIYDDNVLNMPLDFFRNMTFTIERVTLILFSRENGRLSLFLMSIVPLTDFDSQ